MHDMTRLELFEFLSLCDLTKMPGIFKGAAQVKIVRYSSENTKTLSNLCSQILVMGPTGWSPTIG